MPYKIKLLSHVRFYFLPFRLDAYKLCSHPTSPGNNETVLCEMSCARKLFRHQWIQRSDPR